MTTPLEQSVTNARHSMKELWEDLSVYNLSPESLNLSTFHAHAIACARACQKLANQIETNMKEQSTKKPDRTQC